VLVAIAVLLAGCGGDFPPWSAPGPDAPVAVRMTGSGAIEALLVPCTPARITRFEVTAPRQAVQEADDPRLWQVDFMPPVTDLRSVVLGEVPRGGTARIPWPPDALASGDVDSYVVRVELDSGHDWSLGFDPEDLEGGDVRFRERNVSPETFAELSRCP
jgi:hypothetical protein